jgi:ABC-type branched-subunit amino acid transport system substrate-binding protein
MHQDDAYGEAGQAGLDFAADNHDVDNATTQKFKVGDKDVTGQIQRLARAKCDMVFLVATPSDAGTIWGTAAKLKFAPRWIGQSPSWIDELGESPLKPYLKEYVWIASEGTEWGDTKVPGMEAMLADVERFAPKQEPDYYFAFGYNQARAVTALLEKAVELGDMSHDGMLKAMAELGEVDFGGLTGTYTYGLGADRNPPRATTIFEIDPSKPFSLGTLKYEFTSPLAEQYEIKKANI